MAIVILKPDTKFNVGKIIGIGLNYAKHINEMSAKRTTNPVLFLKPSTAILNEGENIKLPSFSNEIHHEVEMALIIGKAGKSIRKKNWKSYVIGAAVALDLTLRDLQSIAKEKGLPWSVSKGFDGACPIGKFTPLSDIGDLNNLEIELYVNGKLKQRGNSNQMIFPPDELVSYISAIFTLEPGDIILTGTPSGVGSISSGDNIAASIEEIGKIDFKVI
jgi:5-carboxymethyl-2-hydroxymuconate isomerase